jgi:hypothetical protein
MITGYGRITSGAMPRKILVLTSIALSVYSCVAEAQIIRSISYVGFEASFGVRTFDTKSNITAVNGIHAAQEGGQLGLVFGNQAWKTRIQVAGFYTPGFNTPHTQELFETAAAVNFYPTALSQLRHHGLFPYVMAGLGIARINFFGKYLEDQHWDYAYEPYIGRLTQLNPATGIGLEYRLWSDADIIHLFVEATASLPFISTASNKEFSDTTVKRYTSLNVGVNFGPKWK